MIFARVKSCIGNHLNDLCANIFGGNILRNAHANCCQYFMQCCLIISFHLWVLNSLLTLCLLVS